MFHKTSIRTLLFRCHVRPISSQTKRLFDLPNELLLTVADFLPFHSKVLFSQTCSRSRMLLNNSCSTAKQSLTKDERIDYLCSIADDLRLRSQFVCVVCNKFHKIGTTDVPRKPRARLWAREYSCTALSATTIAGANFRLQQRHVQLTLRYARMGYAKGHLQRLLQPQTHQYGWKSRGALLQQSWTQPCIIGGKYVLYSKCTLLRRGTDGTPPRLDQIMDLHICPHLTHYGPEYGARPTWIVSRLSQSLATIYEDTNHNARLGYCLRCATDYTLHWKRKEGLTLRIYQDFGGTGIPNDPEWLAHVWTFNNNAFTGQRIGERGDVRSRYLAWRKEEREAKQANEKTTLQEWGQVVKHLMNGDAI